MTVATGIGSWPGDDAQDFAEAVRVILGEVPELPHLPELPARGPGASMVGRALAMIGDLSFDLQPAGWRLTDSRGIDHRRARSTRGPRRSSARLIPLGFECSVTV